MNGTLVVSPGVTMIDGSTRRTPGIRWIAAASSAVISAENPFSSSENRFRIVPPRARTARIASAWDARTARELRADRDEAGARISTMYRRVSCIRRMAGRNPFGSTVVGRVIARRRPLRGGRSAG